MLHVEHQNRPCVYIDHVDGGGGEAVGLVACETADGPMIEAETALGPSYRWRHA